MALLASSVRLVPPTASTQGDVAGQEVCGCFSLEVSGAGGTPRAHAEDPVSPAATTVVIPSEAVAASWRSTSVRALPYAFTLTSQVPYDTEITSGRWAPFCVACSGCASRFRNPSTSPSASDSVI